jgi:uncharacterized membrane protein
MSMLTVKAAVEIILPLVQWLRLALEAIGALCIAVGFVYALVSLSALHLRRATTNFLPIRLSFSRYLSLALEFQLASDILSTSVAPSWDEIGKLSATAVIRTALNYFLSREIDEYEKKQRERAPSIVNSQEGSIKEP